MGSWGCSGHGVSPVGKARQDWGDVYGDWYHSTGPPCLGMDRALVAGLQRTTCGFLVIHNDRRPRVELLADLEHFGGQRDVLHAVVGALAGDKRFNDAV